MTLLGIGQIHVTVRDLARAVAFYRDVLGLTFLFEFPGMAFFDCGGVRLYLAKAEEPLVTGTSIIYYRVGNIDRAHDTLRERGISFLHPPAKTYEDDRHVLWLAFFRDSEDNLLALMEERAKASQ